MCHFKDKKLNKNAKKNCEKKLITVRVFQERICSTFYCKM